MLSAIFNEFSISPRRIHTLCTRLNTLNFKSVNNMNNLNDMTQGRKKFVAIAAAGVVFLTAIGIGNAAYAAGTMAGSARADYGVQSYTPRQVPNVQQYAQNEVQPAPQQFETYRPSPQVAGPDWQRGAGGFGFFGGILRLIGTVLFIGFILMLVRRVFFRGRSFPGGMMGRGPWNGPWNGSQSGSQNGSQTGPWNQRGPWGGPGQGNSGVPPQADGATQEPTAPAASESKPQNPDAL